MLTGKKVAAIATGGLMALGGTGFGLALAKSKTGSAMHHTSGAAMKHESGAAMHHAGSAMHEAPTATASMTG
jgi:hypothetical protein